MQRCPIIKILKVKDKENYERVKQLFILEENPYKSISKFHCLYLQSTSQVFLHHPTSTHSSLVQAAFMSDLGDCSIFLQDLLVCPDSVEVALNVATSGFLSPPG